MKKMTGAGMLVLLAAAFLAGSAQGASCYVVPTNAAAAAPYDTWAKAATSIQVAVDYASAHNIQHATSNIQVRKCPDSWQGQKRCDDECATGKYCRAGLPGS